MATATASTKAKKGGDISDAFVSLSQTTRLALLDDYRQLKLALVEGREDAMVAGWTRLLRQLRAEVREVEQKGSEIIPRVKFEHLNGGLSEDQKSEIFKRGVIIVEDVVDKKEARGYKTAVEDYVHANPQTKGYPQNNPQVFELYWSPPQIAARSHPNLLATQRLLMQELWTAAAGTEIDTSQPLTYADRLRIRQPGDTNFALGPHMDGGSTERWEKGGYGDVYEAVFKGQWEGRYDAWDATSRVDAVYDTSSGSSASGCSVFRMWQGWLSLSDVGPGEGTLLVNPMLKLATVYMLLRPFFRPVDEELDGESFLAEQNWAFQGREGMTSELHGATPGHGQELSEKLHPHLELSRTMVSIPRIKPGDYVAWHCDAIHAVDQIHGGDTDSSVMYIPVCPLTARNAEYARRQLGRFKVGEPGPDFPGGEGEGSHVGRPLEGDLPREARLSMGLEKFRVGCGVDEGAMKAVEAANRILGFE